MTAYRVLVQQGQEADSLEEALTTGIREIAADLFDEDPASTPVHWHAVAEGFAWTGGVPSTTTVIRCDVPDDILYKTRVKLLSDITDLWVEKTGIDSTFITVTT